MSDKLKTIFETESICIKSDRVEDRVSEVLYEYCNGEDAAFIDLAFEIDSLQQQLSSTKQELEEYKLSEDNLCKLWKKEQDNVL